MGWRYAAEGGDTLDGDAVVSEGEGEISIGGGLFFFWLLMACFVLCGVRVSYLMGIAVFGCGLMVCNVFMAVFSGSVVGGLMMYFKSRLYEMWSVYLGCVEFQ